VTQRVWLHLRKSLNDLARQPGDAVERKVPGDRATLVFARPEDFALLTLQVAGVLDRRFDTRLIDRSRCRIAFERHAVGDQARETNLRLSKTLAGWDAIAGRNSNERAIEMLKIPFEPDPAGFER
jgi:hypothetical protein